MGGDGVSMPTILSQLGNVAKTLARNQQAASTASGTLAPQDMEDLRDLKKVPETQKAGNQTIKRRRQKSQRSRTDPKESEDESSLEASSADDDTEESGEASHEPGLGLLIDRKA